VSGTLGKTATEEHRKPKPSNRDQEGRGEVGEHESRIKYRIGEQGVAETLGEETPGDSGPDRCPGEKNKLKGSDNNWGGCGSWENSMGISKRVRQKSNWGRSNSLGGT